MPPHPVRLSAMLWIKHIPNINLLILIMQSKSSFYYLPNNILFRNSQNLYLLIVSENCSMLLAIHYFTYLYGLVQFHVYAVLKRLGPMINTDTVTSSIDLRVCAFRLPTE